MSSVLREIADAILRGIGSEAKYRREHPQETAQMFREREAFWKSRGRKQLAKIAGRRAARWEARAKKAGA